jgi:hypothetical protein
MRAPGEFSGVWRGAQCGTVPRTHYLEGSKRLMELKISVLSTQYSVLDPLYWPWSH